MTDIEYPVSLKAIDKFERQNPTISINVFGHEESVYPLRVSKYEDRDVIDLLPIYDEERKHYCLIKSMSRLLSSQLSTDEHALHYYRRCLNHFATQEKLLSFTVPSGVMISRPCRTSYQSSPSSAIPCFPRDSLCAYRRPFCDVTAV